MAGQWHPPTGGSQTLDAYARAFEETASEHFSRLAITCLLPYTRVANADLPRLAQPTFEAVCAAYTIWRHYRHLDVDLQCFSAIVEDLPGCKRLGLRIDQVGHLSPKELLQVQEHSGTADQEAEICNAASVRRLALACASPLSLLDSKTAIDTLAVSPYLALSHLRSLTPHDLEGMSIANPSVLQALAKHSAQADEYGPHDIERLASCRASPAILEAAAVSFKASSAAAPASWAGVPYCAAMLSILNKALSQPECLSETETALSGFVRLVLSAYRGLPVLEASESQSLADALPAIKHFVLSAGDSCRDQTYPLIVEVEARLDQG